MSYKYLKNLIFYPKSSKGLLYGAIGQSGDGSSDLLWDFHAEENRNAVFSKLGCTSETGRLECLRSADIKSIQTAASSVQSKYREWQWKGIKRLAIN